MGAEGSDVEAELHHVTVEWVVLLALDTDRVLPGPCEVRLNCSLGTAEVFVEVLRVVAPGAWKFWSV